MKAQVREVLSALAAGPPQVCTARLGRDICVSRLWGIPQIGFPRGHPAMLGDPSGKARPIHCSYHHHGGALGSDKGSIRKAELGHTLCIHMAIKVTVIKTARLRVSPCAAPLKAPAPALPPSMVVSEDLAPARTTSTERSQPCRRRAPLIHSEGFPSSPSPLVWLWESFWGWRGSVRGRAFPLHQVLHLPLQRHPSRQHLVLLPAHQPACGPKVAADGGLEVGEGGVVLADALEGVAVNAVIGAVRAAGCLAALRGARGRAPTHLPTSPLGPR